MCRMGSDASEASTSEGQPKNAVLKSSRDGQDEAQSEQHSQPAESPSLNAVSMSDLSNLTSILHAQYKQSLRLRIFDYLPN